MHKCALMHLCQIPFYVIIWWLRGGGENKKKEKSPDSVSYCVALCAHLVSGLELIFGGTMLGPVFITLTLIHGRGRAQCCHVWLCFQHQMIQLRPLQRWNNQGTSSIKTKKYVFENKRLHVFSTSSDINNHPSI